MPIDIAKKIPDFDERKTKYPFIASQLEEMYGSQTWTRTLSPMDELISCILSQNTSDTNRDRGFDALKEAYPNWEDVRTAPTSELVNVIRPAGLANQKAPRIQQILTTILEERGEYNIDFLRSLPIAEAKAWLTKMNGIGPKTAAIVLCFGFNLPAFPVDTHVNRVSKRIGFMPESISVEDAHDVMEAIAPPEDYYRFHIQLITHGRTLCKARTPLCEQCPLQSHCDYYQSNRK